MRRHARRLGTGSAAPNRSSARAKLSLPSFPLPAIHTPGTFLGKAGLGVISAVSDVGFEVPGLGVFYGPN